jgi:hypothetical protein
MLLLFKLNQNPFLSVKIDSSAGVNYFLKIFSNINKRY